jgi:hypothetical protein
MWCYTQHIAKTYLLHEWRIVSWCLHVGPGLQVNHCWLLPSAVVLILAICVRCVQHVVLRTNTCQKTYLILDVDPGVRLSDCWLLSFAVVLVLAHGMSS